MSNQIFQSIQSLIPNAKEIELARKSSQALSNISFDKAKSIDLLLEESKKQSTCVKLPLSAFKLFVEILSQMAEGNAISLTPIHAELTTQEAADLINVSRPYLIRLLETKKIPFRKVGTRRKILFQDLMVYKSKIDEARRKVLNELTEEAQKLNIGY
jgi:excisionase family DNA binding protein